MQGAPGQPRTSQGETLGRENVLETRRTLEFGFWLLHSQALQGQGGEGGHSIILRTKVVSPG